MRTISSRKLRLTMSIYISKLFVYMFTYFLSHIDNDYFQKKKKKLCLQVVWHETLMRQEKKEYIALKA